MGKILAVILCMTLLGETAWAKKDPPSSAEECKETLTITHERSSIAKKMEMSLSEAGVSLGEARRLTILTLLIAGDITVAHFLTGQSQTIQLVDQGALVGATALLVRYWMPLWAKANQFSWREWRTFIPPNLKQNRQTYRRGQAIRDSIEQQGRSIVTAYIGATRANFDTAYNRYPRNKKAAANVIADAALFLRIDNSEIAADDPSIRRSARNMFTESLEQKPDAEFRGLVEAQISEFDSHAGEPDSAAFYKTVLDSWLN
jgi:hypothetical protein